MEWARVRNEGKQGAKGAMMAGWVGSKLFQRKENASREESWYETDERRRGVMQHSQYKNKPSK